MTMLVGGIAAALATALIAGMRLRTERAARLSAENEVRRADDRVTAAERALSIAAGHEKEWLAVLAHEMRSPVSAILGYGELLTDGALGELSPRGRDAVTRMNMAAEQILQLVDGVEQVATASSGGDEPVQTISAATLIDGAVSALRADAEARAVAIQIQHRDIHFRTRPDDAHRALLLALGAAIKVSPDTTLLVAAAAEPGSGIVIAGSRLDPLRDDPDRWVGAARLGDGHDAPEHQPLTGAGFRIALARQAALGIGGSVTLHATGSGSELRLDLPPSD
jgi:signal transduction histidine kinase